MSEAKRRTLKRNFTWCYYSPPVLSVTLFIASIAIELLLPIPGFAEIRTTMYSDDCKIIFAYKRSCKNVMLPQVSVRQSFCPQGGFHVTITHNALGPVYLSLPSNMGLGSSLTSSGGYTKTVTVGKRVVRILIECILAI